MKKVSLEEAVRSLLSEQKTNSLAQWEKEKKPKIDIGGQKHDPSSPNKAHIEEEDDLEEDLTRSVGHASPGLGARHAPRKSVYKTTLGALEMRRWGGNQARRPSTYNASRKLAEAREKALKKVMEKKGEKPTGRTDTGQTPDSVNFQPEKNELTTNH